MGFDLGEIVHPLTKERFISDFWPHRLYVTNAPSKRFQPLYDLDYFGSAEELLSIYPCRVSVQRPDGFTARVPDGKTAIRFYRGGFTCYMRDLERYIPGLREIALQLDRDIGLPKASIKCSVFCSNGESGASMHSDYDLNFQLVLKGKKRWRVAQNHHIVNQTEVCLSGDRPQRDPFQLQLAHRIPFPECMPADAQTVELYAGGVIFVPRGTWHETETIGDGECFSLNFAMKGPQWLTVLLRAIKRRYTMDPAWRSFAHSICGTAEQQHAAVDEFAALLPQLTNLFTSEDYRGLAEQLIADAELEAQTSSKDKDTP